MYSPLPGGMLASPAQALCDFVHLARRQGAAPESLVTFRTLAQLDDVEVSDVLARYPGSVQEHVARILAD